MFFSNISHYREIIQKMLKLKIRIDGLLRRYYRTMTDNGQEIINNIIESCTHDEVVFWLKTLSHQIQFLNLLTYFQKKLKNKKKCGGHIDIVIVAHGGITDTFMPASLLTPKPNIRDTVLYSPWNCFIDAFAACAIAEGWNNTEGRDFCYTNSNQPVLFETNPLPDHWNHMQRSVHPVPMILLTPLQPDEPAWKEFEELRRQGHMDRDGRVIIPFLVPKDCVEAFQETPFYIIIHALSYISMISNITVTVHLAACLGRGVSEPLQWEMSLWLAQYAYTKNFICMTTRNRDDMNSSLFRAFKAMFNY